ncbi:PadR family transcriptional regulator [Actinotalea sp. K2]|uniref:PadR family transcriptional regulator n=1 Tax=Actinotalea sp. K2 TaxID=2939438 RepID=UPI0020171181|nr:PadR family transcriptional regulator [Actinotalea sp. K2]MCL3860982.1 PadR family transcriptional regulator [Actinotalea sp. K2]
MDTDGSERGSRILRGILDACLLSLVAERDRYGYELAAELRRAGLGIVRDGSIYPLVARLERRNLIEGYVVRTDRGQRRRYYRITAAGRTELDEARALWDQVAGGVHAVLHPPPAGGAPHGDA